MMNVDSTSGARATVYSSSRALPNSEPAAKQTRKTGESDETGTSY